MTNWSIDERHILKILERIEVSASNFGSALEKLEPALNSGIAATNSMPIAEAVEGMFEAEGTRIQGMSTRITASVTGVVNSTNAYVEGDLKMAEDAQQAAHSAVYPQFSHDYQGNIR